MRGSHAFVYEEFRAPTEHGFLMLPEIAGLDGAKVGAILEAPLAELTAVESEYRGALLRASIYGGQAALRWTALVPLMMAIGYLALILQSLESRGALVGFLNALSAKLLQGKIDEAEALARRLSPEGTLNAQREFDLAYARGDYDLSEDVLRTRPESLDPNRKGQILRLRGRLDEAERVLRDWMMGSDDAEEARAFIADFQAQVDPAQLSFPYVLRDLHRATGEIAFVEGRFSDAVQDFQVVFELSGQCSRCGLARLGQAWQRAGQADSAVATYERLLATPTDGLDSDDARWLPEVRMSLGELYEERHDTANAIVNYAAFVELWKDADPQLQPRVDDVRRRLESLGSDPGGGR